MQSCLTKEQRRYVAQLEYDFRSSLLRSFVASRGAEQVLPRFDDAWQQVLYSVCAELLDGRWSMSMDRGLVVWNLRFLLRQALRLVAFGRPVSRRSLRVNFVSGDAAEWSFREVCREAEDEISSLADGVLYAVDECVALLSTALRETMADFVGLVRSGDLALREATEGRAVLLQEAAAKRGGKVVSGKMVYRRLDRGRRRLWELLVDRGIVVGDMPHQVGGSVGLLPGRKVGHVVRGCRKPSIRLRM